MYENSSSFTLRYTPDGKLAILYLMDNLPVAIKIGNRPAVSLIAAMTNELVNEHISHKASLGREYFISSEAVAAELSKLADTQVGIHARR